MYRFTTECIVLKNTNYKDSDKIFTLLSKDKGKIVVVAKGVRKIASRRKGTLDTFNHIRVGITESRNSFDYLTEVVPITSFTELKNDLHSAVKGYYMLELCDRLLEPENSQTEVFELLLKVLRLLDKKALDASILVGYFELLLMKKLGYELRFDRCVSCTRSFSDDWEGFRVNFNLGGLICENCKNGLSIKPSDANAFYYLEKGKVSKETYISVETLSLLKLYVQSVLDDKLRTQRIFGTI